MVERVEWKWSGWSGVSGVDGVGRVGRMGGMEQNECMNGMELKVLARILL